jgi:hypothetical protein
VSALPPSDYHISPILHIPHINPATLKNLKPPLPAAKNRLPSPTNDAAQKCILYKQGIFP